MEELKMSADEFNQLRQAFMGGHTHANANYVGQTLTNVASQDFISSYPAVIVLEKFPMSRANHIEGAISKQEFSQLISTKACVFDLTLKDVYHKLKFEHPIPSSKCWEKERVIEDNGRVVMADKISITVTEQDFITYSHFYDWGEYKISNLRWYDKQYLPHEFIKAILKLYEDKTVLKGVVGEEVNYMIYKGMANAGFGMMVTNPVRDEFTYERDDTYKKMKPVLSEAIEKYNENVRRFLFYPWGVWVTAYARRNLFTAIEELKDDFIYSDTDSVKYINPDKHTKYFEQYNKKNDAKILLAAKYHHLSPRDFKPLTKDWVEMPIGEWDYEGKYDKFKTLGAKRYLVEQGGKLKVTIAGANKKKTADYLEKTGAPFENFDNDLRIPAEYAGRLVATYIDEEHSGTVIDYLGIPYEYHELSATHLEPSEYNLTMSDEFMNYLRGIRNLE